MNTTLKRLIEEHKDLDTRTCNVGHYNQRQSFRELPKEDQELLRAQHAAMSQYRSILEKRIAREKLKK